MTSYQYIYVMQHLTKSYPGGRDVLSDITLAFLPGAKIGVLGLNGAGKSTLLRIMAGLDNEFRGEARAAEGVRAGEITLSQATGIGMVMFGAGGESTSALIGSAMRVLAEEPELAEQLRQDPLQIARFVEEVVRLEPPFKFHYRAVRRECELQGYTLGPGDRLMLLWAAANRDPAVFEEPDALRLDRKHPKHHMSFGRGAHFCVGAPLARLEARVMVEEVLRETRQLSLVPGHPPVYAQSIFTRRLESLVVSTRKIA